MEQQVAKSIFLENGIVFTDNSKEIPRMEFPERFDFAIFSLALKGEARLSINLKEYVVRPNNLVLIAPNSLILKQESSDDFEGIFIAISTDLISNMSVSTPRNLNLFLYIQEHPVTALKEKEMELLLEYYAFIRKQAHPRGYVNQREIIYHLFSAFSHEILNIINQYQPESQLPQSRQKETFGRFLSLLKEFYKTNRSVSFYADKLCITPKYLSALSKDITQLTASEWIDRCVILEAKRLLKASNKPIQEISEELNFPNQSFFGKYFKHHTGCSPKEFRNS